MANITTVTPITYSMKIDTRAAANFEATNTEKAFEVTSISVTPTPTVTGAEANYSLNGKGDVLPGTLNIGFTLTEALPTGKTLGWRLEVDAENTNFNYGTNYETAVTQEFQTVTDAAFTVTNATNPVDGTIYWQSDNPLAASTEILIPVKVNYLGSTAGDTITFTVKFFIKSVQEGVDDVIYLAGESGTTSTITVYSSVLTATITTLSYSDISQDQDAFNVADRIIFKTVITADTTNTNYRKPLVVNFSQTMDEAITASTIYINDSDIASGSGADLAAAAKNIAVSDNNVSFIIDGANPAADESSLVEDGLVKDLYVWVVALITKIPVSA